MLIALAAAALVAAGSEADEGERDFDAFALPLVSYNTDLGLGLGAVGGAYLYSPPFRPYRHALAAQAFFTTRGVQNHWFRYDGPRLFGRARLEARLEWRRELYSPYYGAGNLAAPGETAEPSRENRRFAFDRLSPGAWVRLRLSAAGDEGPVQVFAGYAFRWLGLSPYIGSVLLEERPAGVEGGPDGQVWLGALFDTRDDEADPTRGGAEELSLRVSSRAFGSRWTYAGITATERRFFSLMTPRLILGQRLVGDVLVGESPFFEWSTIGGLAYLDAIGGQNSVRGVPRNRYVGTVKLVSNTELRFYPFELELLGAPLKIGGVAFADAGRVWHPGVEDGPWWLWHVGLGGGLRLSRRAAVVRLDYAQALETGRQGLYITFGHVF